MSKKGFNHSINQKYNTPTSKLKHRFFFSKGTACLVRIGDVRMSSIAWSFWPDETCPTSKFIRILCSAEALILFMFSWSALISMLFDCSKIAWRVTLVGNSHVGYDCNFETESGSQEWIYRIVQWRWSCEIHIYIQPYSY